jgi:hypothetical protein
MEMENNNQKNFLDITIHKKTDKLSFSIYRKPTTTDAIIPRMSCHPPEHKQAAIRYMLNRLHTDDMEESNKTQEKNFIQHILHNNGYDPYVKTRNNRKKEPATKPKTNGPSLPI